jgi:hypothetical protein
VRVLLVAVLISVAASARADEPRKARPSVEAFVPVDPYEHERLHYFGRRDHHFVPGTVTINKAPYACDLDQRRFRKREDFVAHLRAVHRTPADRIPDLLVVKDGIVHFIGE